MFSFFRRTLSIYKIHHAWREACSNSTIVLNSYAKEICYFLEHNAKEWMQELNLRQWHAVLQNSDMHTAFFRNDYNIRLLQDKIHKTLEHRGGSAFDFFRLSVLISMLPPEKEQQVFETFVKHSLENVGRDQLRKSYYVPIYLAWAKKYGTSEKIQSTLEPILEDNMSYIFEDLIAQPDSEWPLTLYQPYLNVEEHILRYISEIMKDYTHITSDITQSHRYIAKLECILEKHEQHVSKKLEFAVDIMRAAAGYPSFYKHTDLEEQWFSFCAEQLKLNTRKNHKVQSSNGQIQMFIELLNLENEKLDFSKLLQLSVYVLEAYKSSIVDENYAYPIDDQTCQQA